MEGSVAQRRVIAARMVRKDPSLLPQLESGRLNLSLLELAQGYFQREEVADPEEKRQIFEKITGMSVRRAQRELAEKKKSAGSRESLRK